MPDEKTESVRTTPITIDLDSDAMQLIRMYQQSEQLPDYSAAAWQLLMSALIEWESLRRRAHE